MSGSAVNSRGTRLGIRRATLAIAGLVVGSGGLYVVIWAALGFVLR